MTYGSCRFLFQQFIQRDKAHKIIADTDALTPFSTALIRCADVDRPDQIMSCISGQFVQIRILMNLLDTIILSTSMLYSHPCLYVKAVVASHVTDIVLTP